MLTEIIELLENKRERERKPNEIRALDIIGTFRALLQKG
jgi:hypothetical protein